ncbi:MAG: hypothetical protein O3C63_02525 [Cyanobacteria bacterium]|nr:hypothetical protein [Cyanobacteriota bacterium]MDA1020850.1 hypothetical protein [Cyanobacteriota bacterium]
MNKTRFFSSFILTFWLGMICGVSFFATPIKFLVPGLSRELALQLGDLSFRYLNYIEWLLVVCLFFVLLNYIQVNFVKLLLIVLFSILLLDSFYLLPALHSYVVALSSPEGQVSLAMDISFYHRFYVLAEFTKVLIQLFLLFQLNNRIRP